MDAGPPIAVRFPAHRTPFPRERPPSVERIAALWAVKPGNRGTWGGLAVNSRTAKRVLELRAPIRTAKHATLAALGPGSSILLRFPLGK